MDKVKAYNKLIEYLTNETKNDTINWKKDYFDDNEYNLSCAIYETKLNMPLPIKEKEQIYFPKFDLNGSKTLYPGIIVSVSKEYNESIDYYEVKLYISGILSDDSEIVIEKSETYDKSNKQNSLICLYELIDDKEKIKDDRDEDKMWTHICKFLNIDI